MKLLIVMMAVVISACTSTQISQTGALQHLNVKDTTVAHAVQIGADPVFITKDGTDVTMHPRSRLRSKCSGMVQMDFVSLQSYQATLIAVRNRAGSIGANAMAVINWVESGSSTLITADFYHCSSKYAL
jgi:hypothetical protein